MAKLGKATKKFQSKHLKHTIEQRKKVQNYNKKFGKNKSKKHSSKPTDSNPVNNHNDGEVFEDMDVEKYFEGGIKVPKQKTKSKKDEKHNEIENEDEDGNENQDENDAENDAENKDENKNDDANESSSEDETNMHQQDLEDLAKDDPEFYNYLKNNDKDLLDFQSINPLDAISDDEDNADESGDKELQVEGEKKEPKKLISIPVTTKMVKDWESNFRSDQPSIKNLKNVVIAFKSAVNADSEEHYKYSVTEEKVFNHLMILVLKDFPLAIQKLTPYKVSKNGIRNIQAKDKKIAQISSILKIHSGSLLILLDDVNNTETAALVLQSIQELLPYLISLRKILKQIVNSIVNVWSSAKDVEIQIAAFAFMNNATKEYPKSVLEIILKATYSSFIQNCRKTTIHSMPMINFQKNSAAELFGQDEVLGFQIGFEFVRQLAIHLRNSVNNPSKESYKTIYNWQFCHSLDFWSRMISTQCNPERELKKQTSRKANVDNPLRQLIYPLVQVTIGAIRLIPTAQFFPLRFYLIRSLIRLSQNTDVFIPIFPLLSETLNSSAFTKRAKTANLPAVDFDYVIKVNKAYLNTRVYQEGLCEQLVELISEYFVLYCKSVAFPELTTPPLITLRRYMKKSTNVKFNKQLASLVDKVSSNSKFIEQKRANVEFNPKNRTEVSKFLQELKWEKTPLGAYVLTQRTVREAKQKILRESLEAAEAEEANAQESESEDDINIEEDDDEEEKDDDDESMED